MTEFWYFAGMNTESTSPVPAVVDVSGLSPEAVRAVELLVSQLRSMAARPTDEEFAQAMRELASGSPVPSLPADWSRADLYNDHD